MGVENDTTPEPVAIVECQPPTRLVVDPPAPDDTWRVARSLSGNDDGTTTLVFTQRLAEPYDATDIGPG